MSDDTLQKMRSMAEQTGPGPAQQQVLQALAGGPQLPPQQLYGLSPEAVIAMSRQGQENQQFANQMNQQALSRATQIDERAFDRLNAVNTAVRQDRALALDESYKGLQMNLMRAREGREAAGFALDMEKAKLVADQLRTKVEQERLASEIIVNVPVVGQDGTMTRKAIPAPIAKAAGIDVDQIIKQDMLIDRDMQGRLKPFTDQGFSPSGANMLADPKNGIQPTYDKALKMLTDSQKNLGGRKNKADPSQQAWEMVFAKFAPFMSPEDQMKFQTMIQMNTGRVGPTSLDSRKSETNRLATSIADELKNNLMQSRGK